MANKITKNYIEVSYQPDSFQVTTTSTSPLVFSLKPSRENEVFQALTIPRTDSSGASQSFVLLDISKPHSMLNDVWEGIQEDTFTVFITGTDTNGTVGQIWGHTVPLSWMDVSGGVTTTTTKTIVPPVATKLDPDPAWNSGGHSLDAFDIDGYVEFRVPVDIVQAVVGINELSTGNAVDYTGINYGIYVSRGEAVVMENGTKRPASTISYTDATVFKIERIGGQVKYYQDDVLFYSSQVHDSIGTMVLDVSLYYGGDFILDGTVTDSGETTLAPISSFVGTSELKAVNLEVDNAVLSHGNFISTSSLSEQRNSILGVETLTGTSSITATPRLLNEMDASLQPITGFGADHVTGVMNASLEAIVGFAVGDLVDVSIGSMYGDVHSVTPNMSGLTGGNSLNTTMYLEEIQGIASEGEYASMAASLLPIEGESFTYTYPQARPEVTIYTGSAQGSGTLLHTRKHILTAAHVVEGSEFNVSNYTLNFFGADTFDPPKALSVIKHPDWDGDFRNGNDLAIIELVEQVPWANGVEINQSDIIVGEDWTALSYSPRVDPATGNVSLAGWDAYANTYDDNEVAVNARLPGSFNIPTDSMLGYDFDNGTTENDAYDVVLNIPGTGILNEGIATPGDSGSARIVDGKIAGVASYSGTTGSSADVNIAKNGTYGDFALDVRVSYYTDWIESTVGSLTFEEDLILTVPAIVNVGVGQFNSTIQSFVSQTIDGAEISGFTTILSIYGGATSNLTTFNIAITATGTLDTYATAELSAFNTSILSTVFNGVLSRSTLLNGFSWGISSYGGGNSDIQGFSSVIAGSVVTGTVANVDIGSFTTEIITLSSQDDYAIAEIRTPLISTLYGLVNIGGFNTDIIVSNKLVSNNLVAYAININTTETTQYNNYAFGYIIKLVGKYYGVKADGLYLIEGVDDDGVAIDGKIKTSMMDFGTALHKRVPHIYLDSENITKTSPYVEDVLVGQYESGFNGRRTKLPRGAKGRFWAFEVVNVNGSDMKLGSLEAYAQVLSRKV